MTQAYPLQWPGGRPRTGAYRRKRASFSSDRRSLSVADALKRLQGELDRIGARYPVISSNVELRLDGLPRSGQREPDDPGVALYFDLKSEPHCLPCDTYNRVADNIAAIAKHIEATRAIERYGVASIKEMFAGFHALPAPGQAESALWWNVLGLDRTATLDQIEAAYRTKAKSAHPDAGGSHAAMAELNAARQQAREAARV